MHIVRRVLSNTETDRLVCEYRLKARSVADSRLIVIGGEGFLDWIVG
jgi:hypothetical protein